MKNSALGLFAFMLRGHFRLQFILWPKKSLKLNQFISNFKIIFFWKLNKLKGKKNDGKEKGTACDCKIKYIYEKKQRKNSESAEFNFK